MQEPKKIVIRMPNWLGDAVMASPMIKKIKTYWPKAKLTLFGKKASLELFKHDPSVDHFIILDSHLPSSIKQLAKEKFNAGFLLTNSFSSAWQFYRAKIPTRIGFSKDFRKLLLTHSEPYPKNKALMHHVHLYQKLLQKWDNDLNAEPQLFINDEEKKSAKNFLSQKIPSNATVIGINASAAFGSSKCWLEERFHTLATKLLQDPKVYLLLFGDPSSVEKNQRIMNGLERTINLAGKTSIRELMGLLTCCDLFLTNDSGPMHIACALSVPVVALFGSTSPEATGPYGKSVYIRKKVSCSPCFKRECPIDFRCMRAIEVQHVYQTINQQLQKYKVGYEKAIT